MTKSALFKKLLNSKKLEFIIESHSALSAQVAEEAGFPAIWASSLAIAASLGVRDCNEVSWTQVLDVAEFMADATHIPILLDGDTGYGNFNNVRRLVRKLAQRDVAAVCIEDKVFPKTNSLIEGRGQSLTKISDFSAKIKAAKDAQLDEDFCVIARLEGFVVGQSLSEIVDRANACHLAGADGIMVHSTRRTPDEVFKFTKAWNGQCPVVIAPTTYYDTPSARFEEAGIGLVIWANHCLRASIQAMQEVCNCIFHGHSVTGVQDKLVTLAEVFRLQNMQELIQAENTYLTDLNSISDSITTRTHSRVEGSGRVHGAAEPGIIGDSLKLKNGGDGGPRCD